VCENTAAVQRWQPGLARPLPTPRAAAALRPTSAPPPQVFAPPGHEYVIDFVPLDPRNHVLQPARLRLKLRNCTTGEARVDQSERDELLRLAKVDVKCELCRFGFYRCAPGPDMTQRIQQRNEGAEGLSPRDQTPGELLPRPPGL
jgi:hypothetical protein